MIILHAPQIPWYIYMAIGAFLCIYTNVAFVRHILHWTIIKVLQGIIWLLQRMDTYHKEVREEPRQTAKPKVSQPRILEYNKNHNALEATQEELDNILRKNPHLSVSPR